MITVNELFSGIGSQAAALERLGIDYKVVGIAEIDKYAIKSYEAIHGSVKNYGDISKIEKLDYADFWTYSFPCQDISVAGKQRGINENTRSGLLYEVERLLYRSIFHGEQPKWLMLENVKNLVGKKFKPQFDEWIKRLDELGYNTYWKVLNAKNYGVPQNRERVFAISIRKDIDTGYEFPIGFDNGKRLKDILESEVDEKYYLSDKIQQRLKITDSIFTKNIIDTTIGQDCTRIGQRDLVYQEDCIMGTLNATDYKQPKQILEQQVQQVGNIVHTGNWSNPQRGRIYSADGCSPALNCCGGGGLEPKILIPQATKQGYIECNIPGVADLSFQDSKARRGRVQENGEICPTLTAGTQDICYIEPNVLRPERTEYGKAIRKDYENGLIKESRHNMTEMKPRKDGICNTLTTVQKDNYLLEPNVKDIECPVENNLFQNDQEYINNISDEFSFVKKKCQEMLDANGCLPDMFNPYNKAEITEIAPTQTTMCDRSASSATVLIKQPCFRIRKLTPLECWRLMGFTDLDFFSAMLLNREKAIELLLKYKDENGLEMMVEAEILQKTSNSQLYKQVGNSIVVDVLYYLFKNLFINN